MQRMHTITLSLFKRNKKFNCKFGLHIYIPSSLSTSSTVQALPYHQYGTVSLLHLHRTLSVPTAVPAAACRHVTIGTLQSVVPRDQSLFFTFVLQASCKGF